MKKHTIPVFVTSKILKKSLSEIFIEINQFSNHLFELVDEGINYKYDFQVAIIDEDSCKDVFNKYAENKIFFLIGSETYSHQQNLNYIFIKMPVKINELISLIEDKLEQLDKQNKKRMNFNIHSYNPNSRELYRGSKSIRLTEKESEIFICLLDSDKSYFSKKFLLGKVWKYNQDIDTHTLETHLYSLRKKIDQSLGTKDLIKHEEKKGYMIDRSIL